MSWLKRAQQVGTILLLLWIAGVGATADLDDERELAAQLAARNSPEDVLKLSVSGIPFQGLYRDSLVKQRRGGIILLHGRKSNQDAAELIHPLRVALPGHGWATLTCSLPLAETDAEAANFASLMPESVGRLRAAVTAMQQKDIQDIALIGHDSGAWVALNYLLQQPDPAIRAVVLLDPAPIRGLDKFPVKLARLSSLKLPLLELLSHRSGDTPDDEARERKTALKTLADYHQIRVETPNDGWKTVEDYLLQRLHGWLSRMLARPKPAATPADTAPTAP
ncbi:MAG: hypothetical protein RLZZ226_1182 [Pseudomonadota bacterium]